MRELYHALQELVHRGDRGALITVVGTRGSTPRKAGARMLVPAAGEIVGTIGGGCVEAEVWQESQKVMKTGEPRLFTYHLTADLAADTGMICGGIMDMFIEPVDGSTVETVGQALDALARGETVVLITVLASHLSQVKPATRLLVQQGGSAVGPLAGSPLEQIAAEEARALLREGQGCRVVRCALPGGAEPGEAVALFLEVVRNQPQAIVVGAGHVGVQVARIARAVGFSVIVVDDRADFANPERIPEADRVIAADMAEALAKLKIDRNSYVVLVIRGHREDEAALRQVVASPAAYVGMIGSRTRVRTVKERLIRDGFPREAVEAVHAPIGLNIGAETPEEIALSIVAELVKVMRGGDGESLKELPRY